MGKSTRREFLAGMAIGTAQVLFSRTTNAAEILGKKQDVPAVGNAPLLTVVSVNRRIRRNPSRFS